MLDGEMGDMRSWNSALVLSYCYLHESKQNIYDFVSCFLVNTLVLAMIGTL